MGWGDGALVQDQRLSLVAIHNLTLHIHIHETSPVLMMGTKFMRVIMAISIDTVTKHPDTSHPLQKSINFSE